MKCRVFRISGCTHLELTCTNVTDIIRHRRTCVSESKRTTICESLKLHFATVPFLLIILFSCFSPTFPAISG